MRGRNISKRLALGLTLATAFVGTARLHAQEAPASQPNQAPVAEPMTDAEPPEAAPAEPKPPPPYKLLRYDESYSWLDAPPGTYKTDITDTLKNIHLSDDWRLSIGGEIRFRFEKERNRGLAAPRANTDDYFLHRYFLWSDWRYRDTARIFFEGEATFAEGLVRLRRAPLFENRWDVKQLFVDWRPLGDGTPLTVRVGRQELHYGKQRLISPLSWANVQRRFDALKLMYHTEALDVDAFWARLVDTSPVRGFDKRHDRNFEDQDFLGLYATYKGIPNHTLDGYFLTLLNNAPPPNANGVARQQQIYTIGTRFRGKQDDWDYEMEGAYQTGRWGGDQVDAWFIAAQTGYTLSEYTWTPRLWLAFDYASGDKDPRGSRHGTFNQLFPLGHAYLGYMDLIGRQNIIDPHFGLSFKALKNLMFSAEQHFFFLAREKDALYNAGGAPVLRDPTGHSGQMVGHEIDLLARYKVDRHSSIVLGYSHFEADNFTESTGLGRSSDWFFVQYQIKF
ncbi:MAG: alginate export family protein [Phycisphaerae bacterium]